MRTAVDTSVLLDVVLDDRKFAERSEAALRKASTEGALSICECVLAEIRPSLGAEDIDEFLSDWQLQFVPSTRESSLLAGEMFARYLGRRRGARSRVLADFLVGAHPTKTADRLLARDRGYYRLLREAHASLALTPCPRSSPPLEQRQVAHRQAEQVPADPLQRDLRGEQLHPVARAPELIAHGDGLRSRGEPDAHGADRLVGCTAVGPRDAGRRHRQVGAQRAARACRHLR